MTSYITKSQKEFATKFSVVMNSNGELATDFLRQSLLGLIEEVEKWAEERYIDFSAMTKKERTKMDDGDMGFMHGSNDLIDSLLAKLEEMKQ